MHPTEPPARLLILRHAPLAVAGLAGGAMSTPIAATARR